MAKKSEKQAVIVDPTTLEAHTPEELLARGWLFLTRKDYPKSEADLRSALVSAWKKGTRKKALEIGPRRPADDIAPTSEQTFIQHK